MPLRQTSLAAKKLACLSPSRAEHASEPGFFLVCVLPYKGGLGLSQFLGGWVSTPHPLHP